MRTHALGYLTELKRGFFRPNSEKIGQGTELDFKEYTLNSHRQAGF